MNHSLHDIDNEATNLLPNTGSRSSRDQGKEPKDDRGINGVQDGKGGLRYILWTRILPICILNLSLALLLIYSRTAHSESYFYLIEKVRIGTECHRQLSVVVALLVVLKVAFSMDRFNTTHDRFANVCRTCST
jgi:hypothetical protein